MPSTDHRRALRTLWEASETDRYTSTLIVFYGATTERLPAKGHVHEYQVGQRGICGLNYWLGDIRGLRRNESEDIGFGNLSVLGRRANNAGLASAGFTVPKTDLE